jgi:hypothetical protein
MPSSISRCGAVLPAFLSLTLLLAAGAARAQDASTRQKARGLLVEGAALLGSGDYARALQRFQRAYELVPSPKIHYNLGQAYDGLARPAEALAAFERFLSEASDAPAANRTRARQLVARLRSEVAFVALAGDLHGATLFVDGAKVDIRALRELVVNPGPHSISAEKAGAPAFLARIEATAGQRVEVLIRFASVAPIASAVAPPASVPTLPPVTASQAAASQVPAASSKAEGSWHRPVGWTLAGLGVAAIATGVATLLLSNQKFAAFNADPECGASKPRFGGSACATFHEDGGTLRAISTISLVSAGVLAAGSVAFFLMAPSEPERHAFSCVPTTLEDRRVEPGVACSFAF